MNASKYFIITIDVEDWFQVENFKPWIPFSTWDSRELRVEHNVHSLLDLFDSIKLPPIEEKSQKSIYSCIKYEPNRNPFQHKKNNSQPTTQNIHYSRVNATFFMLGWLAERLPHLAYEIYTRGHEIASHGYNHNLPNRMSEKEFRRDLIDSKKRLEDTIGCPVVGFRAPSFAIEDRILREVRGAGYLYDSSYNSFALHGRYGKISLNPDFKNGSAFKVINNFYEIPISNLYLKFATNNNQQTKNTRRSRNFVLPFGGGAYFRLLPFWFFRYGVQKILSQRDAYVFYAHPWEIDPKQPLVNPASLNSKLRHYTNLHKTEAKLKTLIERFKHCQFLTCSDYVGKAEEINSTKPMQ